MKTKIAVLSLMMVLTSMNSVLAQVGVNTTNPKVTLQIEGNPTDTTTPDGVRAPVLSLAQLDAKVAAYGTDQDGVILYINDVSAGSTETETANITTTGYYYYDASNDVWKTMAEEPVTYSVGDFAHGGIVFWVDATGQHGLVCAKQDQSTGVRWYAGTATNTMARGDGPKAGFMNTTLIIANQGNGDGGIYAARICNELQITEGGKTYGDWYLPSIEELNLIFLNRSIINSTATANGGSNFSLSNYYSSKEFNVNEAWYVNFFNGVNNFYIKDNLSRVRAVRAF